MSAKTKKTKDEGPAVCVVVAGDLAAALKACAAVVVRKATLPVLECARLMLSQGFLEIAATDLDRARVTRLQVEAESKAEGALCVPLGSLARMVSALDKKAELRLSFEGNRLRLTGPECEAQWQGLPVEEFPEPESWLKGMVFHGVTGVDVARALRAVMHAMSADVTRYVLNGVLIDAEDDGKGAGLMVATDGRRLAVATVSGERPPGVPGGSIVPASVVEPLAEMLADAAFPEWGACEGLLVVRDGDGRGTGGWLGAKLIDGSYPNWRQVVPPAGTRIGVDRAELVAATKWLGGLDRGKDAPLRVEVIEEVGAHWLRLERSAPDLGEGNIRVRVEAKARAEMIGVNGDFFASAVANGEGSLGLCFRGSAEPLTVHSDGLMEVVMPMRLQG